MSRTARSLLILGALATSAEARSQSPASATGAVARPGIVTGVVSDSLGVGIVGVTVWVLGTPGLDVSANDGAFRLQSIPSGRQTLLARRIGFRPDTMLVDVVADSTLHVRVQLQAAPQQLAPTIVTSSRARYTGRMKGFNERRDRGMGKYFTEEDIATRRPRVVTDLLRTVPGTRITSIQGQNVVTFRGLRCTPLIWLDGSPATTGYLDVDLFTPTSLAGIEVYPGLSSIPSEFTWMRGKSNCGVIALWTKVPEPRARQAGRTSVKELEAQVQSAELFTADLVDTPAAPDEGHPISPVFPDSLLRAAVGGRVVAEFVVDINGVPNMATFSAVQSTHAMFTEAVRGAISAAKFTPAWRGGKRVRQLVQLPFSFPTPGRPDGS